ncbi:MAG TPA: hypothetical protein VKK79_03290 [Candidatus Lokiarchaeia archaeon]|nr:hypothetical protein [Candidatus Lokiarchaeia archaeon]
MSTPIIDRLVSHLPDIAILTMVGVIIISLALIQQEALAILILLPLLIYLGCAWYEEVHKKRHQVPARDPTAASEGGQSSSSLQEGDETSS